MMTLRSMRIFPLLRVLLLIGLCSSGSRPVAAELSVRGEAPTQRTDSAEKPSRLKVGIEIRWRTEFRDNTDFRSSDDFDHFLGQRLRAELMVRAHPHLTLYAQVQDVWLFGAKSDKVIHDLATNLHQAYLDWRPAGREHWEIRIGRQELAYGEERLVGAFGWDNVGRSFDAGRLRYKTGAWSNDFFWGRVVDVRRGGARGRPAPQDLLGAYLTHSAKASVSRNEGYALVLRDGLQIPGEIPTAIRRSTQILTLGFRRAYQPKTGWRYSLEHAWQFGRRASDPHRAAMLISTGGYAWGGRFQPRLQFEYDFATGDNDSRDEKSREFNNLFPTNHYYYGYADLMGLRNLHDFRLSVAAKPHPRLGLELDYHRFLLASRLGPWKSAVGRVLGFDPTGRAGRDLGQEIDVTFRLPVGRHLNLLAVYSPFLPGAFAQRTRGPETHHFAYIQTTVRF